MNAVLCCNAASYFESEINFLDLAGVVTRKFKITLKALEFTARNAGYLLQRPELHGLYADYLSSFGKRNFDSFRRHRAITLTRFGITLVTNKAQMRFILFAKRTGILGFLREARNLKSVEELMSRGKSFDNISISGKRTFFETKTATP